MNRRDFSILATAGMLGASSAGSSQAMTPASAYRKKKFNSVGSSTRLIAQGGIDAAGIPQGALYTLVSQTNTVFTLNRDGTGVSEGRSVRTVSGIFDPSIKPNTHPMLEVVSWLGLFEYHIEAGVVSIHFKTGGTHGRIEEGFNKGKIFEEEMTSLDGNPNLSGYFSKYHKLLQLYTNGLGTRTTMYSDGKIVTSSWSHTSTSVQV